MGMDRLPARQDSQVFNIMLDEKPVAWNGFPVNTDFRIGIQISQVLGNIELSEYEKTGKVIDLLFPGIVPENVQDAVLWFLNGWNHDRHRSRNDRVKDIDFDIDQWRIYSAFRAQYGIDLNTADLHYWEFMALLTTLEECAFTRVIDIRHKKVSPKMKAEERKAISEAQRVYALVQPGRTVPPEEKEKIQAALDRFEKMRKGK